jgi:hypothetical protein
VTGSRCTAQVQDALRFRNYSLNVGGEFTVGRHCLTITGETRLQLSEETGACLFKTLQKTYKNVPTRGGSYLRFVLSHAGKSFQGSL